MIDRGTCLALIMSVLCISASATAHDPIRAEFTTTDGVKIYGDYWTPIDMSEPAAVVVLLHMYNSNRSAWTPLVVDLEKAGFAILAIDLRGHGESTTPTDMNLAQRARDRDATLFNAMHQDVAAALKWLGDRKEVDIDRVALVGASVGCSVALDSAVRDRGIDAVVLMTPGKSYLGVDSMSHATRYGPRPILVLSSIEEIDLGALALTEVMSPAAAAQYNAAVTAGLAGGKLGSVFSDVSRGADLTLRVYAETGIHGTRMFGKVAVEAIIAGYLTLQR